VRSGLAHPDVQRWFDHRTLMPLRPSLPMLADLKREKNVTIAVCLPALDEEATVGSICGSIRGNLMNGSAVVDELIVMDSGSVDRTEEVAATAGATVYRAHEILPHLPADAGKGEALWKSLAVVGADILVWLDSDVSNFDPEFVTKLIAPLLLDDKLVYTKGFYDRPMDEHGSSTGGRVTELVVRPLLHLLYPELTGLIQPLSGEYAGRREALTQVPFFTGYAVEIGLLIDLVERFGLDTIAQVDLGERRHRNRDTLALGRMSHEILTAMLLRLRDAGRIDLPIELSDTLVQFVTGVAGPTPQASRGKISQRPPMTNMLGRGDN
jgi:glucosyl-3-phosphoglycerate synthase